ncbi:class I SAM-dependent methyltransferase [Thermodesulfobacteriota bacterium]
MFNEIANIIKITRPRHVFKSFTSIRHTISAFKYHYRSVSERDFVYFFAEQAGFSDREIDSAYRDLKHNNALWDNIKERLTIYQKGYGSQMTRELPLLYLLVRLLKPSRIIETGVASGASSAYILQALIDNQKGEMHSIDLPPENLPRGRESGWIVPEILRERWHIYIGDSKRILKDLLDQTGIIDIFLHDSLHTYEHMTWEFNTAWEYLRKGGFFLSHDVGANEAFFDFMREHHIPWKSYRVFHVLGGFKKPRNNTSRPEIDTPLKN